MKKLLMILLIPTILLSCEKSDYHKSNCGTVVGTWIYEDYCMATVKFEDITGQSINGFQWERIVTDCDKVRPGDIVCLTKKEE